MGLSFQLAIVNGRAIPKRKPDRRGLIPRGRIFGVFLFDQVQSLGLPIKYIPVGIAARIIPRQIQSAGHGVFGGLYTANRSWNPAQ